MYIKIWGYEHVGTARRSSHPSPDCANVVKLYNQNMESPFQANCMLADQILYASNLFFPALSICDQGSFPGLNLASQRYHCWCSYLGARDQNQELSTHTIDILITLVISFVLEGIGRYQPWFRILTFLFLHAAPRRIHMFSHYITPSGVCAWESERVLTYPGVSSLFLTGSTLSALGLDVDISMAGLW